MGSSQNAIASLSGLFGGGGTTGSGGASAGTDMSNLTGSNQFMQNYSVMPNTGPPPGVVPGQSPLAGSNPVNAPLGGYRPGSQNNQANNVATTPTFDPNFTQQFYQMLQQQLGTGLPGFNLQTALPGGGTTAPGQLNAPLNTTLQGIQQFLSGGPSNIPGANQLTQMAQTGNPVDQTAAWKAMLGSEQQNIQQNQADIKEQFAFGGALGGSEFGTSMANYENQVTANQNAQLTQATATAQENAMNRQLTAGQGLQQEAQQFGSGLQSLDQQAIQNMLQEFNYTLPQNNPLMQMFGQAATATPGTSQGQNKSQQASEIIGAIGSLIP